MVDQATWVPMPRRKRVKPTKLPVAIERANTMIDWYLLNKPTVRRLAVNAADYKAFEEGVGTYGITLSNTGLKYREFVVYWAR